MKKIEQAIVKPKPILKWAGGKTQLLSELLPRVPTEYNKYIEPFFGGGALFFALQPEKAVIADSNPELINLYQQVAGNVKKVISYLCKYVNTKEEFYRVRAESWETMAPEEAAARTIYLNHTCFNGLYRVNKKGEFNVPFGNYKNPTICDENNLLLASKALQKATIVCGDYKDVLQKYAELGDFIFLDPPYIPISEYADFKRYTKEQFYIDDHRELAKTIEMMQRRGCNCILTNSNHPLVYELFKNNTIEVITTKRNISSKSNTRTGEDVIVTLSAYTSHNNNSLNNRVLCYPSTRFMGSKQKLLNKIWEVSSRFDFNKAFDLFSGSGIVGYMYKAQGKEVLSNDYMHMSATFTKAMVENKNTVLTSEEVANLLYEGINIDKYVSESFKDLYFSDEDNLTIDILRTNINALQDEYKKAIALSALIRACIKKRPRGVFTYTGYKYDDGRLDLQKTIKQHFIEAVKLINKAVFDNGMNNIAMCADALSIKSNECAIVYIDPPYYSPLSDNEYVRRYHFVEGIARDWKGVEMQNNTKTKKFKSYPTPFSSLEGTKMAFETIYKNFPNSVFIVSYSSNCLPNKEEMISLLSKYRKYVDVYPVDYTYSFGNQKKADINRNRVQEYLFVAYN